MNTSLTMPLFLFIGFITLESGAQDGKIPDWISREFQLHSQYDGWITDNSAYRNDLEPYTHYVTEWTTGVNNHTLHGKLYGLADGNISGPFWEFFCFYDQQRKAIRIIQVNPIGVVGEGWISQENDSVSVSEQTFFSLGGDPSFTGHKTQFTSDNRMITQSFEIKEGVWKERRKYIWLKKN